MAVGQTSTQPVIPAASNILCGGVNAVNSVAPVTIITIPAGRTWYGTIHTAANNITAVAADASGVVKVNGSGVTPANSTIVALTTAVGATGPAIGGASGPIYITAGSGAATVTLTNSTATTFSSYAVANGILL